MLTYVSDPLLEACFNFQSRRRALSPFPLDDRTAFSTAAFVFFQNCLFDMYHQYYRQFVGRVSVFYPEKGPDLRSIQTDNCGLLHPVEGLLIKK